MIATSTDRKMLSSGTPAAEGKHRRFRFLLRLVLCCVLLAAIARTADLEEVVATLATVRLDWLLVACSLVLINRILMAYKWTLLLGCRGIRLSLPTAVRVYYVGFTIGVFTPGGLGGDAYRLYAVSRQGSASIVAASIVIERVIGLAVVGLAAVATLPVSATYVHRNSGTALYAIIAVALLSVLAFLASLFPPLVRRLTGWVPRVSATRLGARMNRFYDAYAAYRNHPRTLAAFAGLTGIELLTLIILNFAATRALGLDVSFIYYLSVMPLLHILVRLPISFQGLGVQEGLFAYFLVIAGFSASQGLSVSILHRAFEIFGVILPGTILLLLGSGRRAVEPSVLKRER
jgi:uncharacterized protein (TIRG00374 family)